MNQPRWRWPRNNGANDDGKKKKTQGGESVCGADGGGDAIGDEWHR